MERERQAVLGRFRFFEGATFDIEDIATRVHRAASHEELREAFLELIDWLRGNPVGEDPAGN